MELCRAQVHNAAAAPEVFAINGFVEGLAHPGQRPCIGRVQDANLTSQEGIKVLHQQLVADAVSRRRGLCEGPCKDVCQDCGWQLQEVHASCLWTIQAPNSGKLRPNAAATLNLYWTVSALHSVLALRKRVPRSDQSCRGSRSNT